jgi:5-methyltetrahydropteroyltriglutamate--homocysteine methyltransferase
MRGIVVFLRRNSAVERSDMLLTTIAGSLPKPAWLATPEMLWAPWLLPPEQLAAGQRDAVLIALKEQEAAGIDVVSDGEMSKVSYAYYVQDRLEGFERSESARRAV